MSRNRTTALLVLKGDTILVERYQYDRKPEQRLVSHSMAKTIVAMLVGIALTERKIQSLDDPSAKYVPESMGTPLGQTPLRHLLTMERAAEVGGLRAGFRGWTERAAVAAP